MLTKMGHKRDDAATCLLQRGFVVERCKVAAQPRLQLAHGDSSTIVGVTLLPKGCLCHLVVMSGWQRAEVG
jgi:hypothetical protein